MKWPETLTLMRHGISAYNVLKEQKNADPLYQEFKLAYERDPESTETQKYAIEVIDTYALKVGDHNTPLAPNAGEQAEIVGRELKHIIPKPNVVFVSPYQRTIDTLEHLMIGWPELKTSKIVEEERIREQDHGLALLYNDWRVFCALHPEQQKLRQLQGSYWYRFPQGENVPDVRDRLRDWLGALTRDYSEQNVLAVTHHLAILSLRANLERKGTERFLELDKENKPINCGVTIYKGYPNLGSDGKLVLEAYNVKLY